jgi:hypothetical protein
MIVIAAALSLGVTAAYAATGHSGSTTPRTHVGTSNVVPAGTTLSRSDDPVTHDQADDHGQYQRPASGVSTGADDNGRDDGSGHDAQDDHSGSESHGGDD